MKVSVIMPAYNAEDTISASINSVLEQTHIDIELIIINDCSTDSTEAEIKKYIDPRIIYIENKKNIGVSLTRNRGIEIATGNCIAFLDSDDLWEKDKIEKQLLYIHSGYNIVCSNYFSMLNDEIISYRKSPEIIDYKIMLRSNFIGNLTGLYNSDILGKKYQKTIGHEDYVMWLDIIKENQKVYCIQEPLAKYRLHNTSLSSNKLKTMKWQWSIYRNELKLSLPKSIYYFSHYIINALKKRR
ncbi:glycosyltransferase family 2 protein [Klebsiella variicola]|uniref:glycosyltransferase family 2 protein n=1 Tax=Klebsiella variicola TaxID=244366 RepID=UPI002B054E20|nr:glycosyltransferase family 2 protein [Klebsiella variicola]